MLEFWLKPVERFLSGSERIYWVYLLSSLAFVLILFLRQTWTSDRCTLKNMLAFCVPKAVYTHRSARVDYLYFVVNAFVLALIVLPLVSAWGMLVSNGVQELSYQWHIAPFFEARTL